MTRAPQGIEEEYDYLSDEELAQAKETFKKSDRIHALIRRLEAAETCLEATRKWLVNLGPQEDIDLTMIAWRKAVGK